MVVDCPYVGICESFPHRCKECANNRYDDYFIPKPIKIIQRLTRRDYFESDEGTLATGPICEICGRPMQFCRGVHTFC